MYYGQIMDMLAQHHPEYVSLGWGTFKFLFVVSVEPHNHDTPSTDQAKLVLNHEEMITELSKALYCISAVFPRIEKQLELYQTEEIKVQVERLYAEIIHFYQRALKWYESGKLKHLLGAFVNPYALRFKDFQTKINEYSREIEKLAETYAHMEIRNVNILTQANSRMNMNIIDLLIGIRTTMIGQYLIHYSDFAFAGF